MRLGRFLRNRYSREADVLRETWRYAHVPDADKLSDVQAHVLADLDWAGRRAGMTMEQRQKGLVRAAAAMRASDSRTEDA